LKGSVAKLRAFLRGVIPQKVREETGKKKEKKKRKRE
jgi:hypothetical protein